MQPLFEAMIESVPAPGGDPNEPFQMLVAALTTTTTSAKLPLGGYSEGGPGAGAPSPLLPQRLPAPIPRPGEGVHLSRVGTAGGPRGPGW